MTDTLTVLADVQRRLRCIPPAFTAAAAVPQAFDALWAQTRAGYLDNPLPARLKDSMLCRLALARSDAYMAAFHAVAMRDAGLLAPAIANTLLTEPVRDAGIDNSIEQPPRPAMDSLSKAWTPDTDPAVVSLAAAAFTDPPDARAAAVLRAAFGSDVIAHIAALSAFAAALAVWQTAAPQCRPEDDPDLAPRWRALLAEAPELGVLMAAGVGAPGASAMYQHIFNEMADAVLVAEAGGRYLDVNTAATDLLGYTRDELLAKRVADVVAGSPAWSGATDRRMIGTGAWQGELKLRRRDGTTVAVESRTTAINLADGAVSVSICRDITTRAHAEQVLRESEERFHSVADAAPMLMWMSGADKLCTYFNRGWLTFTGRTMEQELGSGWAEGVHPDDRDRCLEVYESSFDTRRPFTMEYRLRRHDGVYRWVRDIGVPRSTPAGAFEGYIGSCVDITERKDAEAQQRFLSDAAALLSRPLDQGLSLPEVARLMVPYLADCCVALTIEGDVVRTAGVAAADPEQEALLLEMQQRYPPTGQLVRRYRETIATGRPWLLPEIAPNMVGVLARDDAHRSLLRRIGTRAVLVTPLTGQTGPNGLFVLLLTSSGRTFSPAGVTMASDLARRSGIAIENGRLYEQAVTARLETEQAGRVRDEFLSVAAHELKTPVAIIKGYTQLLLRRFGDEADPSEAQALSSIGRSADRLARLVNDLLDVSRLERDYQPLHLEPLALRDLARDAVAQIGPLASRHRIILDDGPAARVNADRVRLYQVLINLLTNAVKFSPGGGDIRVRLTEQGQDAVVTVEDHGVGITAGRQPQIFERFYRAHQEQYGFEGMGVGLYLSREYVERHGGMIWFTSEEGHGSTFSFSIPLAGGDTHGG